MKIKLALLDSDQNYLNRIVTAFNIKYADKLEIYSFTKLESAMAALEPSRSDVLVASDAATFAQAVLCLHDDAALWEQLAANGRANVAQHFSLESARPTLRRLFLD